MNREKIIEFRNYILSTEEGQEMVQEKLKELRGDLLLLNEKIESVKQKAATAPDNQDWFYENWILELNEDAKILNTRVRRFRNMLWNEDGMIEVPENFDIEAIKIDTPIEEIMDRRPSMSYKDRAVYLCPFHNEKTPSFTVYKKSNSWYCYGCARGGDLISLYMALYECSFIEACKQLS